QGLEIGSQVKYNGIPIGRVENIALDPKDVESIIIEVSIKNETKIKKDTKAVLLTLGITGLKIVELQGGTNQAEVLSPNDFIASGESFFDSISGKAEIITQKLETVLNNFSLMTGKENQENIAKLIGESAEAMKTLNNILNSKETQIQTSIQNISELTESLTQTSNSLNKTIENFNTLATSKEVKHIVSNLDSTTTNLKNVDFATISKELNATLIQLKKTLKTVDQTVSQSQANIIDATESLKKGLENFDEFTRVIKENPSTIWRGTNDEDTFEN
ncbi:MCE family protein, partial [bacterium]|nr:MCE family protein [bacterium]